MLPRPIGSGTLKDRSILPLIRDVFKNKLSNFDKFIYFNSINPVNILLLIEPDIFEILSL